MPTVLVRAKERGEYGVAGSEPDPTHKTGVAGYTHIMRNPGEVFEVDVRGCSPDGEPGTGMDEKVGVKINGKLEYFRLPHWMESVKKKDVEPDALVPKGHETRHDKNSVI